MHCELWVWTLATAMSSIVCARMIHDNPELRRMYDEDQSGRIHKPINWAIVDRQDHEHQLATIELLRRGGARTSADYYHAATIFQHGPTAADARQAHDLALNAIKLDPRNNDAKWLAAAAKDRELMYLGLPQLYGTQYDRPNGGQWKLYPVEPTITDEERARWNVPSLRQAQEMEQQLNQTP